jgi:hypothetical protein
VKKALPLFLLAACRGWMEPTDLQRASLRSYGIPAAQRLRVRMDVESSWLTGRFSGVVLVGRGPQVRAQFFPDVGGKAIDLWATRERIVGWFPPLRRGIDVGLDGGTPPHPLLYMGLQLLEEAAGPAGERITGWIEDARRPRIRMDSFVPGGRIEYEGEWQRFSIPAVRLTGGRFTWREGASWTFRREGPELIVEAPGMFLRIERLGSEFLTDPPGLELVLPPDAASPPR